MEWVVGEIAKVCHEANRAYCETLGDTSQPTWDDAPDWQRESAIKGVLFHIEKLGKGDEPSPSASHDAWLEEKRRDGWKYGATKNAETKEHPCFVSYDELPVAQRLKDYIFAGIVKAYYSANVAEKVAVA